MNIMYTFPAIPWKHLSIVFIICLFFIGIMVCFSFPDLFAMYYVPERTHIFNVYAWGKEYVHTCAWVSVTWPPLYYMTFTTYTRILEVLHVLPQTLFESNACPVWDILLNMRFLFWAKFPFFIAHILTAYIFSNIFPAQKRRWFFVWLLNPVSIFVNFIEGQFDSIPVLLYMLALYYAFKKKYAWSLLYLGVGGAYKHYPFLLVVPWAILLGNNWKENITLVIVSLVPYILSMLPFLFDNNFFLAMTDFSENTKMLSQGFTVGSFFISYYILGYSLILGVLTMKKIQRYRTKSPTNSGNDFLDVFVKYSFLISVLYFLITPQWFVQRLLFLMPSLLIMAATNKKTALVLPVLYVVFFMYALINFFGLFDTSLLRPIIQDIPNVYLQQSYVDLLQKLISFCMFTILSYISITICLSKPTFEQKNDLYLIGSNIFGMASYFLAITVLFCIGFVQ